MSRAVDQGTVPVLLLIRMIMRQRFFGLRFLGPSNIYDDNRKLIAEVDAIFTIGRRLALCEAKADRPFDRAQIARLLEAAERSNAAIAILASLQSTTPELGDLLPDLKATGSPLLIVASREPLLSASLVDIARHLDVTDEGAYRTNPVIL